MTRISEQQFNRPKGRKPAAKIDYSSKITARAPDSLVRIKELARTPQNPNSILPLSPATIWRKVKNGTFPAPIRLSDGVTAWRWADIQAWMDQQAAA